MRREYPADTEVADALEDIDMSEIVVYESTNALSKRLPEL